MLFWLTTGFRYALASFVAFLLSIGLSIILTVPFVGEGDDLGSGFLWILIFVAVASLLIPASLGITGELIQRGVSRRSFLWSKAVLRSLLAMPIAAGPVYAAIAVAPYLHSSRPAHWVEKEILLYGVSAIFAYYALRIRNQPIQCGAAEE